MSEITCEREPVVESLPESEPAAAPRALRSGIGWLLGALLVVALFGLASLWYPLGRDQAMFAYVADQWLEGRVPYRDAWDIKPPGVFVLYALAQLCFGHSAAACRIADLIATLAGAAVLFFLARRWLSAPRAAAVSALFGILYYSGANFWHSAQVESLSAPLAVGF